MKIYLASSWRNPFQPELVKVLREAGHEVYDFRHPEEGSKGFHWSEIDEKWQEWTADQYVEALRHPLAEEGFKLDFDAMKWADGCILALPCGRSAHLEAGWFVGAQKPLWILVNNEAPMFRRAVKEVDLSSLKPGAIQVLDPGDQVQYVAFEAELMYNNVCASVEALKASLHTFETYDY